MAVSDAARSTRARRPRRRPRVVIAGGGVAALEALIALRDLLDGFVGIDLIAPGAEFVYRPMSVAEPFGVAEARRFSLAQIAADHSATLHSGRLEAVNNDQGLVSVRGGPSLQYDALFVAVGAQPRDWLPGAIRFGGPDDVARMRGLVEELTGGAIGSVAFVAPRGSQWTLPLYELALLTSAHLAEHSRAGVSVAIVTPERDPLGGFGPAAARHVRELCANRGIELRVGTQAVSFRQPSLQLDSGEEIAADRVVALPELGGERIPGLPYDGDGFIPVDDHGAVRGLPGVYAAGDGIAYPVKQGGLAAQQADAAAEAIASGFGAAIEPRPFRAQLRGLLLTGLGPTYLSAGATGDAPGDSSVSVNPLWWPANKIAARYLAPYLSHSVTVGGAEQLQDRPAATRPQGEAGGSREELRELAIGFADSDAALGDYRSALRWLETVEQLEGLLSPALSAKQAEWRRRVTS
jgi:sulfide:quinone oxidoreductase